VTRLIKNRPEGKAESIANKLQAWRSRKSIS